jgi:hypothetical protein
MKWDQNVAHAIDVSTVQNNSVAKAEKKRAYGRPKRGWKGNVNM